MASILATAATSGLVARGRLPPDIGSFAALCWCSLSRCASCAMLLAARRIADMCLGLGLGLGLGVGLGVGLGLGFG